jgi:hypothetical protein
MKMESENNPTIRELSVSDLNLNNQYYTLRIGESIPALKVAKLKRIKNKDKSDNLPGADYKYLLESEEGKALMINSWTLWRSVSAALRKAGTIQATLELSHSGIDDYHVRALED